MAARDRLQADFPEVVSTTRSSADIRSLRRVQGIPYLLAVMIGLTGIAAVVVALGQLARRRRHELAVLRCEGFTSRQLLGVVLAQATIFTGAALLVGIPVGVVVGRSLWRLAADRIGTDVGPQVPIGGIALAVAGLMVAANLMALVPAWRASRGPPRRRPRRRAPFSRQWPAPAPGRRLDYSRTTLRRTSPACIFSNAPSTPSSGIVSLTKRSRSSRPCR